MYRFSVGKKISVRGFTLIELIVVIAIIGIISSITTMGFNHLMVKSRVEAQVRKMVSDISELRIRALTTKQRHSVTFNPSSYVFRSYTSEGESLAAGTVIPSGTTNVTYNLKDKNKADFSGLVRYEIDTRGVLATATAATVFLDYNGNAAIDCFTLHFIRINPGKKRVNGAEYACDDK